MSVFLYNEQPLVTLPVCWLKQPTSDTEGWRGKARRRSTSRLPVEHTRSHLDTLTNSADKVFWSNSSNRCWLHSYFHQNKTKKKETGCHSWRLQKYFRSAACYWPSPVLKHIPNLAFCSLYSPVKGQPFCGMSLAHKSSIRDQTALSLCSVWAPTCTFLSDPLPRLRGSWRGVHRGVRSTGGTGRTIKTRGKSYPATCPSQRCYLRSNAACRQPEGAAGAKHNKSWNSPSKEPTDMLESCSRTQQCRLFVL